MNFLPLSLGIRKISDAERGAKKAQAQLKQKSEKTLKRDDFTCRFCGFRSTQYQRTIPWQTKGSDVPMVTACTFCEQCVFLDRAGAMGSGILIWLPEIKQTELNHLARSIYVARAQKTGEAAASNKQAASKEAGDKTEASGEDENPVKDMVAAATRAQSVLMARRSDAKRRLGSDDPMMLATIMHESLSDKDIKQMPDKIEGIRLLPLEKYLVRGPQGDVNQFPKMVQFWQSPAGPYGKVPVEKWAEMFRGTLAGADNA